MDASIRIIPRQGSADVVIEGLTYQAANELTGSILRTLGKATAPPAPANGQPARSHRKRAPLIPCPICGRKVRAQGLVSHERTHSKDAKAAK
jgi:hypothetical protein